MPRSTHPGCSANISDEGKNYLTHLAMKTNENFNFPFFIEENTISVLFIDLMNFTVITVSKVLKH